MPRFARFLVVWTTAIPERSMTQPRCDGACKTPSIREDSMSRSARRGRTSSPAAVAGNGLINRRALLGQGIALAGAVGVSGATGAAAEPLNDEPWSLAFGETTPALQTPSRFEKSVVRALSNPK